MKVVSKKLIASLSPILGAGGIGVCPLCWAGSASLLTYLGLAAVIPYWRWLAFALIGLGVIGFALDFKAHREPKPLIILIIGGLLLYLGRYVYGGAGFGGWPIWGAGGILIIWAVVYNRSIFKKLKQRQLQHQHV
jgi:hypothetical protein